MYHARESTANQLVAELSVLFQLVNLYSRLHLNEVEYDDAHAPQVRYQEGSSVVCFQDCRVGFRVWGLGFRV